MKKLISLLALVTLAACGQSLPPDQTVTKLLSQDGCTVYRFYDQGYRNYFASCPGASVSYHQPVGKTRRLVLTPTVRIDTTLIKIDTTVVP